RGLTSKRVRYCVPKRFAGIVIRATGARVAPDVFHTERNPRNATDAFRWRGTRGVLLAVVVAIGTRQFAGAFCQGGVTDQSVLSGSERIGNSLLLVYTGVTRM